MAPPTSECPEEMPLPSDLRALEIDINQGIDTAEKVEKILHGFDKEVGYLENEKYPFAEDPKSSLAELEQ